MPETALASEIMCVLGTHRSGSSAVTRAISLLGYRLPKTLIKDNASNRRGHWESQPIVRLNEAFLQDADVVWSDWITGDLQKVKASRRRDFEADLHTIIADEFEAGEPAVLKDPRMCRLMPHYRTAFEGKTKIKVIVPIRNPLEVVGSLVQRNNLSDANAALLWLRYNLDAVSGSEGLTRAFVSYEHLLRKPLAALSQVEASMGSPFPTKLSAAMDDIQNFLNSALRNQQHSNEDLLHNDLMRGWVSDTYDALRALTHDPEDKKALKTIQSVRTQLDKAEPLLWHIVGGYDREVEELRRKNAAAEAGLQLRREQVGALRDYEMPLEESEKALKREVKRLRGRSAQLEAEAASHLNNYLAVTNSTSWRITRPLRAIISRLRGTTAAPREAAAPPFAKPSASEDDTDTRPHVADTDIERLENSEFFDASFYLESYPEAQGFAAGPAAHYLNIGWLKGYDPSPVFTTQAYEQSHADVLKDNQNPLLHFIDTYAASYQQFQNQSEPERPRIAVFSAITGAYDDIKEPKGPTDGVDFFLFTDGRVPAGSVWQPRALEYIDADPTRSARFVKTHPHLYFGDYDYAIWMDANLTLCRHPSELLAFVSDDKPVHSWKHPLRICVYEEAHTCVELRKDETDVIKGDLARMRREGFPKQAGLIETSVMVTKMSDPTIAAFYNAWWARIDQGSRRDQLSLPPARLEAGIEIGLIAPERICMRTDPRFIYERHRHIQDMRGEAA
jgi:hypothetical protein